MFHCTCLVTTNKHLSFRLNSKTGPISVILSFNSTHKAANKIIPFNSSQCREEGGCSVSSYLRILFSLITLHHFYFRLSLISPHNFLSSLSPPPLFFCLLLFLYILPIPLSLSSFILLSLSLTFFTLPPFLFMSDFLYLLFPHFLFIYSHSFCEFKVVRLMFMTLPMTLGRKKGIFTI